MNNEFIFPGFKEGDPTFLFGTFSLYPFAIFLGILASIFSIAFFWNRNKYQWDILLTLIIITIPTSIIGARLFYIFERLIYNSDNPFPNSHWYAVWEGGLSIQGGVLAPLICDLIYLSFKKDVIDRRNVFGIILPTVLLGQAIGRWGNFTNHEVFGRIVSGDSLNWLGQTIKYNMLINGTYHAPLFLYESIANFLGYFIIVWVILNFGWAKPGTTGALYLIWYGLTRVVMEPLREESYSYYTILAVLSICFGVILAIYFEWNGLARYEKIRINNNHSLESNQDIVKNVREDNSSSLLINNNKKALKLKFSIPRYEYINKKVKYISVNVQSKWINE